MSKEEIWQEVSGTGKFAERGESYFNMTWSNAEDEVRKETYQRTARRVGTKQPSPNGAVAGGIAPGEDTLNEQTSAGEPLPGQTTQGYSDDVGPDDVDPDGAPKSGMLHIKGNKRQLRDVTGDALAAILMHNSPPTIFQRGNLLTRLRIRNDTKAPFLEPLSDHAIRGVLTRTANWYLTKDTKEGPVDEDDAPPMEVVQDLATLPEWPSIPQIESVIEAPSYSRDDKLIVEPGYHADAAIWYHQAAALAVPEVPVTPTAAEITEARNWLLTELFGDFPFADDASRAHALATLLLPFVRPMIDGPTPLHLFDAPVEGTGKTLLLNCTTVVVTGREAEAMVEGSADEEWRKRVTAVLAEGPIYIFLDNLSRILDSGALAGVLTATTWKDRILGFSRTLTVPNLAVWLASGNNTRLSRELIRRTIWCRIDAKVDAPWERSGWRHPNLGPWTKANRGKLIWAALTLVQAWLAAGKPAGTQTLGMFESWTEVIGGILAVAGVPGLLANAKDFRKVAADKADEWRAFVESWWQKHNGNAVGVAELFNLATSEKLLDSVMGDEGERSQRTRLGFALKKCRDRVFGKYRIEAGIEDNSGRQRYQLREVLGPTNPATTETTTPTQPDEEVQEWSS